jgi:hypothetical protein
MRNKYKNRRDAVKLVAHLYTHEAGRQIVAALSTDVAKRRKRSVLGSALTKPFSWSNGNVHDFGSAEVVPQPIGLRDFNGLFTRYGYRGIATEARQWARIVGDRVGTDVRIRIGAAASIHDPTRKSDCGEKGVRTRIGNQAWSDDRIPKPMIPRKSTRAKASGIRAFTVALPRLALLPTLQHLQCACVSAWVTHESAAHY